MSDASGATTPHPPSPFATAGGFVWLPRMLHKARLARTGGLGEYLVFEDSPLDQVALARWRVTGAQVGAWLDQGLDDEAIATQLATTLGLDAAGRARWSERFMGGWRGPFFRCIDADEGRTPPGLATTVRKAVLELTFRTVSLGLKLRGRR